MGMYTGVRFKGVVKEEFRKDFEAIALRGEWENSAVEKFKKFSRFDRSSLIPRGSLAYMPDSWEKYYINEKGEKEIDFADYYKLVDTDGFDRTWNEDTGYWSFQCSLKNYSDEIEEFIKLLPYFIESIEHLETYYEEDQYSIKYELKDGKINNGENFKDYNLKWENGIDLIKQKERM